MAGALLVSPDALAGQGNPPVDLPTTPIVEAGCVHLYLPIVLSGGNTVEAAAVTVPEETQLSETEDTDRETPLSPSTAEKLAQLDLSNVPIITTTLVYTENTTAWIFNGKPIPQDNPSGLEVFATGAILPDGTLATHPVLLETDGEEDEKDIVDPLLYDGTNMVLFDTVTRQVIATASTVNGTLVTDEPAGVAAEMVDGRVRVGFSDDQGKKEIVFTKPITDITSLQPGSSFSTDKFGFGNEDPEGMSIYRKPNGKKEISLVGGATEFANLVGPGDDGEFNGYCIKDDDVRKFAADALGMHDSEGIFSVPDETGDGVTHYMLSNGPNRKYIHVVRTEGDVATLVQLIDVGQLNKYRNPAGIAVFTGENGNQQIAIVYRGSHDNTMPDPANPGGPEIPDPNDNDGILGIIEPYVPAGMKLTGNKAVATEDGPVMFAQYALEAKRDDWKQALDEKRNTVAEKTVFSNGSPNRKTNRHLGNTEGPDKRRIIGGRVVRV